MNTCKDLRDKKCLKLLLFLVSNFKSRIDWMNNVRLLMDSYFPLFDFDKQVSFRYFIHDLYQLFGLAQTQLK